MTKKIIAFLLIIATIFALACCGKSEDPAPSAIARGTWEGDVFKSDFADLAFKLPDKYQAYSDEQLAQLMKVALESLNNEAELVKQLTIYDVFVQSSYNNNFSILYENLAKQGVSASITASDYLDILADKLEDMSTPKYTAENKTTVQVAGKTFDMLETSFTTQGVNGKQYYVARRQGGYMICIIISIFNGDDVNSILSIFTDYAGAGKVSQEDISKPSVDEKPVNTPVAPSKMTEVKMGQLSEDSFFSENLGYTFTPTGDWKLYTRAQLAGMMEIDESAFDSEAAYAAAIKNASNIYEMMAAKANGENVIVAHTYVGNAGVTVDSYVSSLKANYAEQLIEGSDSKATIAGKEFKGFTIKNGDFYQYFLLRVDGDYFNMIIFTSFSNNGMGEVLDMFS